MANTGSLFVAVPASDDPINEISDEDQAHVTLCYFGEFENLPEELVEELEEDISDITSSFGSFACRISGTALLGADKASVVLLESAELVAIRSALLSCSSVLMAQGYAEQQFAWWIPHLTIRYEGGVLEDPPESVQIDALAFWKAEEKERFSLGGGQLEPSVAALCMPTIATAQDLSLGIRYGAQAPDARWYVMKRADALGMTDRIPVGWSKL